MSRITKSQVQAAIYAGGSRGSSSRASAQTPSLDVSKYHTQYLTILRSVGMLYCHFCSDPVDKAHVAVCVNCGALMCIGLVVGGAGCIGFNTLKQEDCAEFWCPKCSNVRKRVIPYWIAGSGLRRFAKMAWPLALITLQLPDVDDLITKMVVSTTKTQYGCDTENLHIAQNTMNQGGDKRAANKIPQQKEFINSFGGRGIPPNLIVVVDTHSDSFTGLLSKSSRKQGLHDTIMELAMAYVGRDMLNCMQEMSAIARNDSTILRVGHSVQPWADMTPRARGGWRVMVLVACGSAVRQPMHWNSILELFNQNLFDVFVSFGGLETMPLHVLSFVNAIVQRIATMGMANVWDTIRDVLIEGSSVLISNSVVVAFKDKGSLVAREVGMHSAERPLGFAFRGCGTESCQSQGRPGHILGDMDLDKGIIKVRCTVCSWRSRIKLEEQDFFKPLHPTRAPLLMYHQYPSPPDLRGMFLRG